MLVATVSMVSACSSPVAAPTESVRSRIATPVAPTPTPDESLPRPTIVKLRLRDVDLTIESSANGPRFVLSAIDGAVLERDLDDAELAARYPDVYQVYRSALVKAKGTYLDARLDSPRDIETLPRHRRR
jgi:hypothetical protein